jgi:hypothetical protein
MTVLQMVDARDQNGLFLFARIPSAGLADDRQLPTRTPFV